MFRRNRSVNSTKEKKKLKKFNKVTININSKQSFTKLKPAVPSPSTSLSSNLSQSHPNEDQYILTAHLELDILTVTVYHAIKSLKWRQQFTQNSFKRISIHKVSKILIRSIQETANKANKNKKHKNKSNKKRKKNDFKETREVKIFENNGYCYVALINSDLPTFALRPIYETSLHQSISYHVHNNNHLTPYFNRNSNSPSTLSTATNTTITTIPDIDDKGPGFVTFVDADYYKHKTSKAKNNVKYGFV